MYIKKRPRQTQKDIHSNTSIYVATQSYTMLRVMLTTVMVMMVVMMMVMLMVILMVILMVMEVM